VLVDRTLVHGAVHRRQRAPLASLPRESARNAQTAARGGSTHEVADLERGQVRGARVVVRAVGAVGAGAVDEPLRAIRGEGVEVPAGGEARGVARRDGVLVYCGQMSAWG
jgi:hypothetical protein